MNLLIKLPSRERPQKFFDVLNKAQRNRELQSTRFLITLDSNDALMKTDQVKKTLGMWGNLTVVYGESKSKIDAVNRDMDKAGEWDIVLLLSDDMHVNVKSFDKIIVDLFEKHFPDTDGALWLNDGHTGKRINTIVCMGRKRYEKFGYLYHSAYKSFFCDNEYTDLMIKDGNYQYIEQVLIEHKHPMNTGRRIDLDNLYRRNDAYFHIDKRTYENRKHLQLA